MLADAAWYVRSDPHMTTQLIGDRGIAERLTSEVARDVEQLASASVFQRG